MKIETKDDSVEDLITFIQKLADFDENETLRGFMINLDKEEVKNKVQSPRGYYFVTDLCNPTKKYLETKFPLPSLDIKTQKKFIRGKKIHRSAEIWVKKVAGYVSTESKLDGFLIGLPVTGRIDGKIKEKILDFKSKEQIPRNPSEIIQNYPQDIEQLAFYSVLDPTQPNINYLVFISQDSSQKLIAFRIIIKDHQKIKNLLLSRINLLNGVFEGKIDPSQMSKCNYCLGKEECGYYKEGVCKWIDKAISTEISNFVDVEEDKKFTEILKKARENWNEEDDLYSIHNLLNSRKYFYTDILEWGLSEEYDTDTQKMLAKDYVDYLVYKLRTNMNTDLSLKPAIINKKIREHNQWIFLKTNQEPEGKLIPYVVGASLSEKAGYLGFPPNYRIAELGMICALYNRSRGYVFEYLPNLNKKFRVYELSFKDINEIKKKIEHILKIFKSKDPSKFKELPECYNFYCNDCEICDEHATKIAI